MMPAYPMHGMVNHPAIGLVPYTITEVADDPDTQVQQTIGLMSQYAMEDSTNPLLLADSATCRVSNDPAEDVWRYLSRKDGVRQMSFVHDEDTARPWGDIGRWRPIVETLIRPVDQVVLPNPQGDCDDFSMYGAAHLLARGVPCCFCTVAADGSDPSIYSHVYLVAYPQTGPRAGQRVPLDLSHGPTVGWETENRFGKRKEWPVGRQSSHAGHYLLMLFGAVILYQMFRGVN